MIEKLILTWILFYCIIFITSSCVTIPNIIFHLSKLFFELIDLLLILNLIIQSLRCKSIWRVSFQYLHVLRVVTVVYNWFIATWNCHTCWSRLLNSFAFHGFVLVLKNRFLFGRVIWSISWLWILTSFVLVLGALSLFTRMFSWVISFILCPTKAYSSLFLKLSVLHITERLPLIHI